MLEKCKTASDSTVAFLRKHSRAIGLVLMACLMAFVGTFFCMSLKIVSIQNGNDIKNVYTLKSDVAGILGHAGFDSSYNVTNTSKQGNRLFIEVAESFPVHITVKENTTTVTLSSCTVAQAIAAAGITLGEKDFVNLTLGTVLTGETYIDIVPYVEPQPEKTQTVSSDKVQNVSASVNVGGKNTISTLTPSSPIELDENGVPVNYSKVVKVQATAYTYTGFRCSTGVNPQPGYIAVNPKVIPYGTKMYIVSADGRYNYGYAIAADTGGFIKSRPTNVDLFMETAAACKSFGRRDVYIYFITE